MSEMKITFKHPEEIREFVNMVSKYDFVLGIMHLGLNNVMDVKLHSDDCEELQKKILKYAA